MRKEEGATVAATPYLLSAGWFVRPDGRRLHGNLTLQESPIKYRKCPTNEQLFRQMFKQTPAIFSHLIGPPRQMKQIQDAE